MQINLPCPADVAHAYAELPPQHQREPFVPLTVGAWVGGISKRLLDRLIVQGDIPSYVVGGRRLVRISEVVSAIEAKQAKRTNRGRPRKAIA